jgi:hypothetical protein
MMTQTIATAPQPSATKHSRAAQLSGPAGAGDAIDGKDETGHPHERVTGQL